MFGRAKEPNVVVVQQPSRTQYVDRHVTVTEKRAPTDDSVKLLREMEQKAEAEIVKSVRVGNATFECVIHQFADYASDDHVWRAVFKLNGKQMKAEYRGCPKDMSAPFDAMDGLRNEMTKVIAAEVLHDAFVALMRERVK